MIVASHRGPERFERTGEGFRSHRGAGGVVSALRPLLAGTETKWVAAAIGDDDRAAVEAGAARSADFDLHLLALDPALHHRHYQVVSNAVLWFLHHGLFDLVHRPRFDGRFDEAWDAYREVNRVYADEIAAAADEGDAVLVQDYHLALVPGMLSRARPDLGQVFFQHTPHCDPNSVRVLPAPVSRELLGSMGTVRTGFHTARWSAAYEACREEVLGLGAPGAPAFHAPLGIDPEALERNAASDEARAEGDVLEEMAGDRQVVLRVDRIEPAKNVVRGFLAYDLFLERHPEWRERVVFVALLYPSRESLPEYLAYRQEIEQVVDRVNDRWATAGWQPVVLDPDDVYPRSLAGLRRYDVLLVNPVRDGLNLVAKEGPFLNRRDGVLALSPEAGAFDELGDAALAVHPFDLGQTAAVLHKALTMDAGERRRRAGRLRDLTTARTSRHWLDDLVEQAEG